MKTFIFLIMLPILGILGIAWSVYDLNTTRAETMAQVDRTQERLDELGARRKGTVPAGSRLVTCFACDAKISRDAKACPKCGDPR